VIECVAQPSELPLDWWHKGPNATHAYEGRQFSESVGSVVDDLPDDGPAVGAAAAGGASCRLHQRPRRFVSVFLLILLSVHFSDKCYSKNIANSASYLIPCAGCFIWDGQPSARFCKY
jgi:hypothetical protein